MNEEWCWDNVIWVRGKWDARNGVELRADAWEPRKWCWDPRRSNKPELRSELVQSGRRQKPALWQVHDCLAQADTTCYLFFDCYASVSCSWP